MNLKKSCHRRRVRLLRRGTCPVVVEPSTRGTGGGDLAPIRRANARAGVPQICEPSRTPKPCASPSRTPSCWRSRRTWSFWRCRTASPPNTPCRCSMQACIVIDLSADFRLKSAEVYREFYGARSSGAGSAGKISLWSAGNPPRGDPEIDAGGVPGLLSDQHSAAADSVAEGRADQFRRHHRRFVERRQRRGSQGRAGLPVLRMQRKRAALRRAQAPAFVGNRGTAFAGRRHPGHHPVHAASDPGEPRHFDDALSGAGESFLERGGNGGAG